jgi:starch phosphorylase
MLGDYVAQAYLSGAERYRRRAAEGGRLGRDLRAWEVRLAESWDKVRLTDVRAQRDEKGWEFEVHAYLENVRVELYAEGMGSGEPVVVGASLDGTVPGMTSVYRYLASAVTARPAEHFTPRVVPFHREVLVPMEQKDLTWAR